MQKPESGSCSGGRVPWALVAGILFLTAGRVCAQPWPLQESIQRAQSVSPSIQREQAALAKERGQYEESGLWPNPSLQVTTGNELQQELPTDEVRVRNVVQKVQLTQSIPVGGRTWADAEAAEHSVSAARFGVTGTALSVAHETARLHQRLYHAQASVAMAERQLKQAERVEGIGKGRADAGDIAPREASRLSVLAAETQATLSDARRQFATVRERFRNQLNLAGSEPLRAQGPLPVEAPPGIGELEARLAAHPELTQRRNQEESARARVRRARAARIPDVNLTLGHKRFEIMGESENAVSVGVGVELPLWTTYAGRAASARGEADESRQQVLEKRRGLERELRTAHESLTRLLTRLKRHRKRILEPSRNVLAKSEQGYRAGDVTLTELIDATNTVWRAERTEAELLLEARTAQLKLKEAAGLAPGESM